jgi:hypothetical protein
MAYPKAGKKHDDGKLRWDLLPLDQIEHIVEVLTFGAKKYTANNWQLVENAEERYFAALMRHLTELRKGNTYDKESGLKHTAHALCCMMFILWFEDQR